MVYETMGLLVFRRIASFDLAQELTGGLIEVLWRKLGVWVETVRLEQSHPQQKAAAEQNSHWMIGSPGPRLARRVPHVRPLQRSLDSIVGAAPANPRQVYLQRSGAP